MTRYLLLVAGRSRQPLVPVAATLFALLGVFAYRPNEVGSTWGLTSLLAMGLGCWTTAAVLRGEPDEQADVATVALGGEGARRRLQLVLVAGVAAGLTALFTAYPVVLGVFDRPVRAGDVASAVIAHGAAGLLGGTVAVLVAPQRVPRGATAAAAAVAILVSVTAASAATGAGPTAAASALTDQPAGTVSGSLLAAAAASVLLAAALAGAAARWDRWRSV